jgi:hypothetical protein
MSADLEVITPEHARTLTDRIKVAVEGTWHLITEAYRSRAWAALGYTSWDDYCTREFGTSRLRLPREERSEVVASMRELGMSNRAIASAAGISEPTVRRELGASYDAPVANETPANHSLESVAAEFGIDLDDDEPALTEEECQALDNQDRTDMLTDAEEAEAVEAEVKAARITGTDGKSYPKPEPKTPRRAALPEAFWQATYELGKKVTTLTNLAADDRFKRNTDQVRQESLPDLIRTRYALQRVIDQLTN